MVAGLFTTLQLNIWDLPFDRFQLGRFKSSIDLRETPAPEKLPG